MANSETERRAMRRALEIAANGPRGKNPQVGAVILSPEGDLLAEGWHRGIGTAHAEVDALSHLSAERARGATAVVTLEPCNHTGRTGPCAEALIAAGVARVVYAVDDPGVASGGGAERLRAAGIDVTAGVLADEVGPFLAPWIAAARLGRAHVTVKWAQSLDGRAAASDGSSRWITGPAARADVHMRRAASDAIIVGTGTVISDDPSLTARHGDELYRSQPVPVVVGTRTVPAGAAVRRHPHEPILYDTRDLAAVLTDLHDRGLHRVFVDGGPTLASALISAGFADRILCYVAPVLLGGDRLAIGEIGVPTITAARRLTVDAVQHLGDDLLFIARPAAPPGHTSATAALPGRGSATDADEDFPHPTESEQ